ncbi:hypothetical protein GO001_03950 [Streptomyces sp. NRRL B-1677]|uniref:hypothetical protein n=1 Tax=Streptomyces TaxID=1883 RepID=UPI0018929F9A|nr:hypothetical protein [Streptomyces sp. NRRL B-1677]MBF6044375.1 hypothetical protein [Streptomyces sp. NRRL B-1677]
MSIGSKMLLNLIRGITSPDPVTRDEACGSVTDLLSSLDAREVDLLAIALSSLTSEERIPECRESQLHALVELLDTGHVKAEHVTPIWLISRDTLGVSEAEYIEHLEAELRP